MLFQRQSPRDPRGRVGLSLAALLLTFQAPAAGAQGALHLDGSSGYATFGDAPGLGLSTFTIECWFRRDGPGSTAYTGGGGVNAIPLVTKGRSEGEGDTSDMNYFFGIGTDFALAADFEEGPGGLGPEGLNHPVAGATAIQNAVWYHAAATYDGAIWSLYLNGSLEALSYVGEPVQAASVQHAGLGTALNSLGVAEGYFQGALDEVRIWDHARTQLEIQGGLSQQLASGPGLVGRWGLDEGTGTTAFNSIAGGVDGMLIGGASWTSGAPFQLNAAPQTPTLNAPADGGLAGITSADLSVDVFDSDGDSLNVSFYGRRGTDFGSDFTLVILPDTQYYTGQVNGGVSAMLRAQVDWILSQQINRNIVYVVHLGDCVENGDNGGDPIEWMRADSSLKVIEDPVATGYADGLPYGVCVGNHDQSPIGDADGTTTFYNQYFGEARFAGRSYYGGHYGSSNDNWFNLFSASGLNFIVISLEYDSTPDSSVIAWADSLLQVYPERRGVVASHHLIGIGEPGAYGPQGQAIYDVLKKQPNLFLMLAGHVPGEGRRQDTFNGRTIHTLLSNYQEFPNGGDGWLRIMAFSPVANVISVSTYSPWLDAFRTESTSQFNIPYTFSNAFQLLGSFPDVPSGTQVMLPWTGLNSSADYEWYASASDGQASNASPVWSFTTATPTSVPDPVPGRFQLGSVTPNPAHGDPAFSFTLGTASRVEIEVVDVQGRIVDRLAGGSYPAGRHELRWVSRGRSVPAGLYFVRMRAGAFIASRRFVRM